MSKIIYTCFSTDVIHSGHLNIINIAKQYGDVYVGVLSDSATVKYNKFPTIPFEKRVEMIKALDGVKEVLVQDDVMYDKIVEKLHPDYIIHGDNWTKEPLKALRDNAEKLLSAYGGKVIDVPYTYNESVRRIDRKINEKLSMPEYRRKRLKQLIKIRPIVKAMEVHSGLTGLLVEKTVVKREGEFDQFDAMWLSSLCDSTAKGKPDIELVDMTSRFKTIDDIMDVTTKPIVFDGDTGGLIEHFVYMVHTLERMGVSAVIIEDKTGLKKNSLFGTEVEQTQDDIEHFCEKIRAGNIKHGIHEQRISGRVDLQNQRTVIQNLLNILRKLSA